MKSDVLFSVIVPVYRVEAWLDRCVQSLLEQTFRDIEIILVDDGSPDRCPVICDTYAQQDPRVKVIHKENGGLSDARNLGLQAARGTYVLFVDSDDYLAPDTCERFLPFAETGCDIIVGDGVAENGKAKLTHGNYPPDHIVSGAEYLKTACGRGLMPMEAWLYVYRRAFLEENELRFKKGILHEDEQFIPRVFLKARRVVESGICFYHYVIRDGSITAQNDLRRNAQDFFATCLELQEMYETLDDRELKELLLDSLVVKYLSLVQRGSLYRYGSDYLHKDFIRKNAFCKKTKCKAALFCISPRLYWHVNRLSKQAKNH